MIDDIELNAVASRVQASWTEEDATRLLDMCSKMVAYHSHRVNIPGLGCDDLAQELRLQIFVALDQWDPARSSFGQRYESWCRYHIGHLFHRHTQHNGTVMSRTAELRDSLAAPELDWCHDEDVADMRRRLESALTQVQGLTRRIVGLRLQGKLFREISDEIGMSEQGVHLRLGNLREVLRASSS